MNKKIICLLAASAMSLSSAAALTAAAENTVTVVVDGSAVEFTDQKPVIENDRTLIPVRGAFEAMNAKVDWDGEARKVTVKDSTGTKYAFLTIGSDVMETQVFKSLFDVEKAEVKLDVPAQIKNDRTMIPLRAVGEALGADVSWDGDTYTATITSKTVSEEKKSQLPSMSISLAEPENDNEVVIDVNASNIEQFSDSYVGTVSAGLNYDPAVLEFVSSAMYAGDTKIESAVCADNAEFTPGRVKAAAITVYVDEKEAQGEVTAARKDGCVMKLVFRRLSADPTKVSLSTSFTPTLGHDTFISLDSVSDEASPKQFNGLDINIDTTELEVK